jgi:ferrous iron transport protein B
VILAVVGATMGPLWALAIYVLDLAVAAAVGHVLSRLVPGRAAGLLMDIPPYRVPPFRSVLRKVWFRMYEFLVAAWPVLIAASVVMGLLQFLGIDAWLNAALRPLTAGVLGLPEAVGVTLFFGILRKELSLVLLFQALGTADLGSVLSPVQLLTFTVFVTFYVPCVSTLAASVKEIGWKWTGVSAALNTGVALAAGFAVRLAGAL